MRYRVIREYGLFYPQVRQFGFWWHSTTDPEAICCTLDEALEDIEQHKKVFSKGAKKKTVVWEGED